MIAYPVLTSEKLMREKLTPSFVAKAKASPGKDREIFWDRPGFGLVVTATGHKSWVVQYRVGQRSRRMTIKGWLALAEARKQAMAIQGVVSKDGDPLGDRRKQELAGRNTLRSIAEVFLDRESKRLRSIKARRSVFERLVFPTFGTRQIDTIRRSEIVKWLDEIEDEHGPRAAHICLAYLSRLFNWHATRDDEFKSPIVRGMGRINARERARNRILSDDELRSVWQAASPSHPFGALLRFVLLTATRRNEAGLMMWGELSGRDWTIPAGRYKSKIDHLIPLSTAAVALLDGIPKFGPYVFTTNGKRPIGAYSQFKRSLDAACGVKDWIIHDLRRTARSLMSRAGVDADLAERCLGHVIAGVRGIYDRHAYYDEKKHAFEALAALVERIVDPPAGNVVTLRKEVSGMAIP
jgi:integrase